MANNDNNSNREHYNQRQRTTHSSLVARLHGSSSKDFYTNGQVMEVFSMETYSVLSMNVCRIPSARIAMRTLEFNSEKFPTGNIRDYHKHYWCISS